MHMREHRQREGCTLFEHTQQNQTLPKEQTLACRHTQSICGPEFHHQRVNNSSTKSPYTMHTSPSSAGISTTGSRSTT